MSLAVRLRSIAEQDLANLAEHIGRDRIDSAIRFLDAADRTILLLAKMPAIGAEHRSGDSRLAGVRVWPIAGFPNHLLFYRATHEELEVIRVLHGARQIDLSLNSDN